MSEFSGDALLAKIKPKLLEIRTQVCLRPDLLDALDAAQDALDVAVAEAAVGNRLNGGSPDAGSEQALEVQRIEAEIEECSPWFTLRALPAADYEALCAKHPPRKDVQMDLVQGYNLSSMEKDLVRKCLIDPTFSDEGWAALLETFAIGEWTNLRDTALEVNGSRGVVPPKSRMASRVLSKRAAASA